MKMDHSIPHATEIVAYIHSILTSLRENGPPFPHPSVDFEASSLGPVPYLDSTLYSCLTDDTSGAGDECKKAPFVGSTIFKRPDLRADLLKG